MATITGLTAERMLEIEGASVVSGEIVANRLILTKFDGTTIDAGPVGGPPGPQGPAGPAGGQIPGEVKLWPASELPLEADYGNWAWADGAVYAVTDYPIAAAYIAPQWRTFAGASDPGGANFRVPDLRGLVPAGLDAMPGGARANRLTRSVSIVLAGKTGQELHTITVAEMPSHGHPLVDPGHHHSNDSVVAVPTGGGGAAVSDGVGGPGSSDTSDSFTGITIGNTGDDGAHENMQPTVFVPYIVKLDD